MVKKFLLTLLVLILPIGAIALSSNKIMSQFFNSNGELQIVEASQTVSNWDELKNTAKNASKKGETIVLSGDILTNNTDERVIIDGKKNLVIDLNGHKIEKKENNDYKKNGHIFEIQGDSVVTIKDSIGGGALRNSTAKNGGAINIHEGSSVTIENVILENNKASVDGGAICNNGYLKMSNCIVRNNSSKDTGGAIYNSTNARLELTDVEICNNYSDNDGGGLNIHTKGISKMVNCNIHHNTAKDEGGGFRFDDGGERLELYNTTISNNNAGNSSDGGGFYLEDGTINLYGCTIENNSARRGGGFYLEDKVNVYDEGYGKTVIRNNSVSQYGAGIYCDGDLHLKSCEILENTSISDGAGIYVDGGNCYLEGAVIKYNSSSARRGGGIYVKDADLIITDGTITNNKARQYGGGVLCQSEMDTFKISNKVIIIDNDSPLGADLMITDSDKIEFTGKLDANSYINYTLVGDIKYVKSASDTLTKNYGKYHGNEDPNKYFKGNIGCKIKLSKGEVYSEVTGEYEPGVSSVQTGDFIPWNEQIDTNTDYLNGSNWLSGVSGERRLNEINVPVTHDSSMAAIASATDCIGSRTGHFNDAVTQYLYIYEQLEAGIRGLDLRLNNKRVWKKNKGIGDQKDDGKNLFMCHGKDNKGGTYFAKDPDTGYPLNFLKVLDWVEKFLAAHPTEFVYFNFGAECQHGYDKPKVWNRLEKILKEHIGDINPATNEPYFYLQDGEFGKNYSDWPKLKDVRGKILINHFGGMSSNFGGKYIEPKQDGSFKQVVKNRIRDAKAFINKECYRDLPTDASTLIDEVSGKPIYFKTSTNCTGEEDSWIGAPADNPYKLGETVNSKIFGVGNLINMEKAGKYLGWFSVDSATGVICREVYMTNFFSGLQYKTITIKSNKDGIQDQVFKLLKGSEIVIPGYIYNYEQNSTNGYFTGWSYNGTNYDQGTKFTVNDDMTILATWGELNSYDINTSSNNNKIEKYSYMPLNGPDNENNEEELVDYDVNVYWLDGEVSDFEFKLKNNETDTEYECIGFDGYIDDKSSLHTFSLPYDPNTESVNIDKYTVIIEDTLEGLNINIFQNETGYYLIVANKSYEHDYDLANELINGIGKVTRESEEDIFWAESIYYLLPQSSKDMVTNYEILTAAKEELNKIIFGRIIAAMIQVTVLSNLENITYNETTEKYIASVRKSYDELDEYEKSRVDETPLILAEEKFERLKKAALENEKLLNNALTLIEEINDVEYTPEINSDISKARSAYNLLSDEQKQLVSTYNVLVNSEAEYYAKYFIAEINSANKDTLKDTWSELTENWNKLDSDAKNVLVNENAESETVKNFQLSYSTAIAKSNEQLEPLSNGPTVIKINNFPAWAIALIVIGGVAVLTLCAFVTIRFIRKKKGNK